MSKRIFATVILGMIIVFIMVGRFISYCENEDKTVRQAVDIIDEIKMFYNAWVVGNEDGLLTFLHDGVIVESECDGVFSEEMSSLFPCVADIKIMNGKITEVTQKTDRRKDRLLAVTTMTEAGTAGGAASASALDICASIETLSFGTVNMPVYAACYDISDSQSPVSLDISGLPIGYDVTEIVFGADGAVCAVLVTEKVVPQNIRVAVKNSDYKSHYHEKVVINSDKGLVVSQNGAMQPVAAGQKLEYDCVNEILNAGRITITPCEGGFIYIENIKRGYKRPAYRGKIELKLCKEGITVVNELPVDEYLYSVVPSEMPVSYGVEALKVQAVCARTYAYIHIKNSALTHLGAHVDDSTSYQVYNNTSETPESIEAVNATRGQVVTYEGKVVPTYYFSTSCGVTANGTDVWFGMKDVPYLSGKLQTNQVMLDALGLDLSDDAQFAQFLKREDIVTYDSNFPWYRWNVKMSAADIKNSIDKSLEKRYNANPSLILTKNKKGDYVSEPVSTVGEVKSIKVIDRTSEGLVTCIIIKGSERTVKIKSEYNIRTMLAPISSPVTRKDGSVVNSMSLLPSAFVVISIEGKGGEKMYTFEGGGYGHGVGMSQNGTRSLVLAGATYMDILKFYFSGCEVETFIK